MNTSAFDELAQLVSTRRLALRGGAALLLGSTHIPLDAEAKCRRPGAKCDGKGKCCSGSRCKGKRCRCKAGNEEWAGVCCRNRFALQDDALGPGDPYI